MCVLSLALASSPPRVVLPALTLRPRAPLAGQERLRLAQRLPLDGPVPRRCVSPFSSLALPARPPRLTLPFALSPVPPADKAGGQGRPRTAREGPRRAKGQAQHSRKGVSSRRSRKTRFVVGRWTGSYLRRVVTLESLAHPRTRDECVHDQVHGRKGSLRCAASSSSRRSRRLRSFTRLCCPTTT